MSQIDPDSLRSKDWFRGDPKTSFIHRSWMKIEGIPDHEFNGKPIIGICNTWSELTPCNVHFRELAEMVKRGILEAGGFPVEFPVMSLGEPIMRPTTMLFRNLVSMDVEESIRANPMDGVVFVSRLRQDHPVDDHQLWRYGRLEFSGKPPGRDAY